MASSPQFTKFRKLMRAHRAIFFDAYGVLNDSRHLLPGVSDTLLELKDCSIPFWIISNDAAQSPQTMSQRYVAANGEALVTPDQIITAGLLASQYVQAQSTWRHIAYLGPTTSAELLAGGQRVVTDFGQLPPTESVDCLAIMDDAGFEWELQLNRLVNYLRRWPHVNLLGPNPDLLYHASPGQVGIAAGALTRMLEAATGVTFRSFGKPGPDIFLYAMSQARSRIPDLEPAQIMMVGDNLLTDIPGAKNLKLAATLVLSGNTTQQQLTNLLSQATHKPDYICEGIGSL